VNARLAGACCAVAWLSGAERWPAAQSSAAAAPAAELREQLDRSLHKIARAVDGVVGYAVLDLTSGDRFSHLANATFPTASAIKIAIVYELYKQVEEGKVRLDERVTLDHTKAVGGTGVLVHLDAPTLSIGDYATLMVIVSDNTATNLLIDRLGMGSVTRRMLDLGLSGTRLRRHMMDVAAARRGEENVSTPDEMVRLLQTMYGAAGDDRQTMDAAIQLLEKPKQSRLRRGLPAGVVVADKPGELEGVRVDAGIVFAKNRPYVFAAMATFLGNEADGERAIEEMSHAAYAYFSRVGGGGALGRLDDR